MVTNPHSCVAISVAVWETQSWNKKNHDEHISDFGQGHICTRKSTIQGGTLAMQNGKNSEKRQPAKE
jgi:hypothetical protein